MTIETKYNVDDSIWFIYENKAKEAKISVVQATVRSNKIEIEYYVNVGTKENYKTEIVKENNCYYTREELINNL